MALTLEQHEYIERLKDELGIDAGMGAAWSKRSQETGGSAGINPVTPAEGEHISRETFNVAIRKIVDRLL